MQGNNSVNILKTHLGATLPKQHIATHSTINTITHIYMLTEQHRHREGEHSRRRRQRPGGGRKGGRSPGVQHTPRERPAQQRRSVAVGSQREEHQYSM